MFPHLLNPPGFVHNSRGDSDHSGWCIGTGCQNHDKGLDISADAGTTVITFNALRQDQGVQAG